MAVDQFILDFDCDLDHSFLQLDDWQRVPSSGFTYDFRLDFRPPTAPGDRDCRETGSVVLPACMDVLEGSPRDLASSWQCELASLIVDAHGTIDLHFDALLLVDCLADSD